MGAIFTKNSDTWATMGAFMLSLIANPSSIKYYFPSRITHDRTRNFVILPVLSGRKFVAYMVELTCSQKFVPIEIKDRQPGKSVMAETSIGEVQNQRRR